MDEGILKDLAEQVVRDRVKQNFREDPSGFINRLTPTELPVRKTRGKTGTKRLAARERMLRALQLRLAGYNYDEIAKHLGYSGRPQAYKAVKTILDETMQEPADELRRMECAKIDQLVGVLWIDSLLGDHKSIDRIVKLLERKAKLMGLDAPVKVENMGLPPVVRIENAAKKKDGG